MSTMGRDVGGLPIKSSTMSSKGDLSSNGAQQQPQWRTGLCPTYTSRVVCSPFSPAPGKTFRLTAQGYPFQSKAPRISNSGPCLTHTQYTHHSQSGVATTDRPAHRRLRNPSGSAYQVLIIMPTPITPAGIPVRLVVYIECLVADFGGGVSCM
jgi:hypothetical protein